MMQNILKAVVACAVVLLVAGCATEGAKELTQANGPVKLGVGDTMGRQLYTPVTGTFAMRQAAQDVSLAGVNKNE
jgi:hypothetical protein